MALFPLKPGGYWPDSTIDPKIRFEPGEICTYSLTPEGMAQLKLPLKQPEPDHWPSLSTEPNVWKPAKGKKIPISDLSDGHLANIIRMLRGWAESELEDDGHQFRWQNESGGLVPGDQALIDNHCARKALQWPALLEETNRRQTKMMESLEDGWYHSEVEQSRHLGFLMQGGQLVGFANLSRNSWSKDEKAAALPKNPASVVWGDGFQGTGEKPFYVRTAGGYSWLIDEIKNRLGEGDFVKVKPITHTIAGVPLKQDGIGYVLPLCLGAAGLLAILNHKTKSQAKTKLQAKAQCQTS